MSSQIDRASCVTCQPCSYHRVIILTLQKNFLVIPYTLGGTRNSLLSNGMSFHRLLCVLVLVTLHAATLSSASIYPTKPISTTVFTAGQPAQLKWIEDGHPPLLRDTGKVKIQLFAGNDVSGNYHISFHEGGLITLAQTFLATLARNVQPQSLSRMVYIPLIIPRNYNT